jgi:glycosyltransferase involved in cell wall biosynthesis
VNDQRIIALLGRRDEPTDAVEEYCRYLSGALRPRGFEMEVARVDWTERGWAHALRELQQKATEWRGRLVLLQYTALAWSACGFPLRFLRIIKDLRGAGAFVGIVYHDVEPYSGGRMIDILRRRSQLRVMRRALAVTDLAVFTVPLDVVSWASNPPSKAVFIPVGANLPVGEGPLTRPASGEGQPGALGVAVFGFTEGETGRKECAVLLEAIRFAATRGKRMRLHAFGRGADKRESDLREGLKDMPVEVRVEGVLPAEQVVEALSCCDVALFVRAPISSRRGSAIAAIACGLPMIAYAGADTAPPITDAGVLLVSREKKAELGEALLHVLSDAGLRGALAERSVRAQKEHFGWDAIAERYVAALKRA